MIRLNWNTAPFDETLQVGDYIETVPNWSLNGSKQVIGKIIKIEHRHDNNPLCTILILNYEQLDCSTQCKCILTAEGEYIQFDSSWLQRTKSELATVDSL